MSPQSKAFRRFAPAALTFSLLLIACAPPAPPPPQANPAPRHVVRVHGAVPANLQLEWFAIYEGRHWSETCRTRDTWSNLTWHVPIEVKREGDRYEAFVEVDKFLPGECDWRFSEADVIVRNARRPDESSNTNASPLQADWRDFCRGDAACVGRSAVLADSSSTPVDVHCRIVDASRTRAGVGYLVCQDVLRRMRKIAHVIRPATKVVEVNFIDMTGINMEDVP